MDEWSIGVVYIIYYASEVRVFEVDNVSVVILIDVFYAPEH